MGLIDRPVMMLAHLYIHSGAAPHACSVIALCSVMVSRSAADRQTELKTLRSVRLRTLVEPLVTLVLACPGQATSQKGLRWCMDGKVLVSAPGPPGVLRS